MSFVESRFIITENKDSNNFPKDFADAGDM